MISIKSHFIIGNINKGLCYWPGFQKIADNISVLHKVFFEIVYIKDRTTW